MRYQILVNQVTKWL